MNPQKTPEEDNNSADSQTSKMLNTSTDRVEGFILSHRKPDNIFLMTEKEIRHLLFHCDYILNKCFKHNQGVVNDVLTNLYIGPSYNGVAN